MDGKSRIDTLNNIKIFAGNANPDLAKKVCDYLSIPLGNAIVGRFPDGEIDVKVNEDVRGSDIFIIQPTCPPVNENLAELLILIDCFKRASSARITAVLPYYGYARIYMLPRYKAFSIYQWIIFRHFLCFLIITKRRG